MSRKSTCAISSSISFLTSAAIWIHMEMPDATILSIRLPRVERKARRSCACVPNAPHGVARYSDPPKRTNAEIRPFPARRCRSVQLV
jgi:hypothetical protein